MSISFANEDLATRWKPELIRIYGELIRDGAHHSKTIAIANELGRWRELAAKTQRQLSRVRHRQRSDRRTRLRPHVLVDSSRHPQSKSSRFTGCGSCVWRWDR